MRMVAPNLFSTIALTASNSFTQAKTFNKNVYTQFPLHITSNSFKKENNLHNFLITKARISKSKQDYNLVFLLHH